MALYKCFGIKWNHLLDSYWLYLFLMQGWVYLYFSATSTGWFPSPCVEAVGVGWPLPTTEGCTLKLRRAQIRVAHPGHIQVHERRREHENMAYRHMYRLQATLAGLSRGIAIVGYDHLPSGLLSSRLCPVVTCQTSKYEADLSSSCEV